MTKKAIYEAIAAEFLKLAALEQEPPVDPPVVPEPPTPEPPTPPEPPVEPDPPPALTPLSADPIVTVAKPVVGQGFIDPTYGVKVTRATQGPRRHNYSRRQAFSHDGKYFLTAAQDGYWFLHDANTCAEIKRLNGLAGDCEPIWSPSGKILHAGREGVGGVWYWLDVESNTRTVAFDLNGKTPFPDARSFWTKGEGTTSADGRYIALMAETYSGGRVTHYGIVTVDVIAGTVVGSLATSSRPDHVSMSPSGNYAVVSWTTSAGTRAYKRDFSGYTQLHSTSEHSDLAIGPNGEDFYVYTDYAAGQIRAKNLATGAAFDISSLYPRSGSAYAAHISGQGFGKPGWVVVSTYADNGSYGNARPDPTLQPQYRKVWLAELKPGGQKLNLCHIRSTASGYFAEPQATASRDLSRVMFASNLGSGSAESYIVDVP